MTKKLGPLPIWAWGLILGVGGYFLYERYSSGSSSSTTTGTTGILDPNAVDPNTGLTYGEEESAAENANAASMGSSGGGGTVDTTPAESGLTATGETGNEIADLTGFLTALQGAGFSYAPTTASTGTTNAQSVTTPANPPTTSASAHTSPQVETHPGGPFYNWYIKVFGKAPPGQVNTKSTAYQLWKNGVSTTTAKATIGSGKATTAVTNAAKAVQPTKPKAPKKPKPTKVKGP